MAKVHMPNPNSAIPQRGLREEPTLSGGGAPREQLNKG